MSICDVDVDVSINRQTEDERGWSLKIKAARGRCLFLEVSIAEPGLYTLAEWGSLAHNGRLVFYQNESTVYSLESKDEFVSFVIALKGPGGVDSAASLPKKPFLAALFLALRKGQEEKLLF